MSLRRDKASLPTADEALPGRAVRPFAVPERHFVLGTPLEPPFPEGLEQIVFGMGCCWGAEDHHQQYLAKNPSGYCGLGGTGVSCPIGVAHAE
jgi:hypothetical protein